jgi:hypothetical protein
VHDDQRCRYRSYAGVRLVDLVHKFANIDAAAGAAPMSARGADCSA